MVHEERAVNRERPRDGVPVQGCARRRNKLCAGLETFSSALRGDGGSSN